MSIKKHHDGPGEGNPAFRRLFDQVGLSQRAFARVTQLAPRTIQLMRDRPAYAPGERTITAMTEGLLHAGHAITEQQIRAAFAALPPKRPDDTDSTAFTGWAHLSQVPTSAWAHLIGSATARILIADYAPTVLLRAVPDAPERLAARASAGVDVRVLLAQPGTGGAHAFDTEAGTPIMTPRARAALDTLTPALANPARTHLRQHTATLPSALYISDNTCWISAAVHALHPDAWPVITTNEHHHTLTTAILAAYDRLWDTAAPRPHTP